MKILVTGGAGFIGSHVADAYIQAGHQVVVVDNLSTGHLRNLNPKAKFYLVDIRETPLEQVFEWELPDVVNHHAAQMDVRKSVTDPIYDAEVNILGALRVLQAAHKYGVKKFIHISSGGAAYGEPEYNPVNEAHPVNPLCPYGITKHTLEHYLFIWKQLYGLEYAVLRYPNVYGPRQDPQGEAGVTAIFANKMLLDEPITINGDGEQTRDYVYISDIARANVLALEAQARGIYNLGWGKPVCVNEIFERLRGLIHYSQEPHYGPGKLGETRHICLDASRARLDFGWAPSVPLADGLRLTAQALEGS